MTVVRKLLKESLNEMSLELNRDRSEEFLNYDSTDWEEGLTLTDYKLLDKYNSFELEAMKDELLDLEELHESEITEEQQKRLDYLANEIELYSIDEE